MNLLEGWACQVGFKDSVLHYLAKFSSAIDLLATPSEQLLKVGTLILYYCCRNLITKCLQLNWSNLRHEFPVLNPSQLHYIVSQYLLPPKMFNALRQWTPSKDETGLALGAGK